MWSRGEISSLLFLFFLPADNLVSGATPGTYYLWIRGYGSNAAGDSLYIGLDEQPVGGDNRLTGFAPRAWDWANGTMSASPALLEIDEPGLHTLHLWMREDGLLIDRVLLTTDETYIPTDSGPSESVSRPMEAPP